MIIECEECAGTGARDVLTDTYGHSYRSDCLECMATGTAWDGPVLRVVHADGEVVDWPCLEGDEEYTGCLVVFDHPGDKHPYRISGNGWGGASWATFWGNMMNTIISDDATSVEVLP